ncbi:MAG: Conserved hypothetical secreted protein [Pseudomonadota bacterium]|jgi:hypothetical protein
MVKIRCYIKRISCICLLLPQLVFAIDLLPDDVIAPPPGIQQIQINYQRSERGDRYSQGQKTYTGGEIINTQTQLKYGRSFELNALPAYFYVQTPITEISTSGIFASQSTNSGPGDTTFAFALWPYANRNTDTYIGLASYLTIPSGSYHNQNTYNAGENRYKWALQAGYEQPIYKNLNWMSAVDTLWFSENDDYGNAHDSRKQKALHSAQTAFIYKINSIYTASVGYFYSVGGVTSINGASQNDMTQNHRYQISGIANLPIGRLTLQYGQEMSTRNGFIEDARWILRYSKYFK